MRHDVVGAVGHVARPERVLRARPGELDEIDLLHAGVGVAPLTPDELDALVGLEVDDRVGLAGQELGRAGKLRGGARDQGRHHAPTFTTK
jgi:hypothetical protein